MDYKEVAKKQSEANFSLLLRYYKRGTIIPFIGSGFSSYVCGKKFPQWKEFLINYANELGMQQKIKSILDDVNIPFRFELAATSIAENDTAFTEKIQDFFSLDNNDILSSTALVRWLPKLFPQSPLLTSNLDTVIETAYRCHNSQISQILYGRSFNDQQLKRIVSNKDHILLKIHGCTRDRDTIIFSENQYARLYGDLDPNRKYKKTNKEFPTLFRKLSNNVRFLFLGCSLCEDRYLELLKQNKDDAKEDVYYHFAIISAPDNEEEFIKRQEYLASCGIAPIWYSAGCYEQISKYLSRLFEEVQDTVSKKDETIYTDSSEISHSFIDPIAQMAHNNNIDRNLAKAIMLQSTEYSSTNNIPQSIILKLCNEIADTSQNMVCPLEIRGNPGTGKSTLLSLLFLNMPKPIDCYTALIDLHCYDEEKNDPAATTPPDLTRVLAIIDKEIKSHNSSILFIDGFNRYARTKCKYEDDLRKKIYLWKKSGKVRFVFAIGKLDNNQFPPFVRETLPISFRATHTIELSSFNANTSEFRFLVETVVKTMAVEPNKKNNQKTIDASNSLVDNLITFCKKLSGSMIQYRTVVFAVRRYLDYKDNLFELDSGRVLLEYFLSIMDKDQLSKTAEHIALFMLSKNETPQEWTTTFVFKSPAFRDFFFAIYYLDAVETGNINRIRIFDCIFTPSINRFIVSMLTHNKKREQYVVTNLIDIYEKLGTKAKNQVAYLLGRVSTQHSKKQAKAFLQTQFKILKTSLTQHRLYDDEETVMLFRSTGISLIYLGDKEYEDEFFSLLIYNESIRDVNLKFHITYYTTDAYNVGDAVNLSYSSLYTTQNIENLYSFLFRSIDTTTDRGRQGVNIITIISLSIYQRYKNNDNRKKDDFIKLISTLASDVSITNPVLKRYIFSIKAHLEETNIYTSTLSRLYSMKTIERGGWLEKGREIHKQTRVESDADHTWGCCLLAQILLTDRIEDCAFLSHDDKTKYASKYDKSKIINLLLVHDLPEIYTGDIPINKQTIDKKEQETTAMQKIAALDSFPFFHSFHSLEQLWQEFDSMADINATIAYQIDKIEPLVQLYIYRFALPLEQRQIQLDAWVQKANEQLSICKIHTSFGSNVLEFLTTYLLGEDFPNL